MCSSVRASLFGSYAEPTHQPRNLSGMEKQCTAMPQHHSPTVMPKPNL